MLKKSSKVSYWQVGDLPHNRRSMTYLPTWRRSPTCVAFFSTLLVSLFHPRRHRWDDHFILRGTVIEPLTAQRNATARLLKLNLTKRIVERQLLAAEGRYPR
jgi:hypothetical protein